MINKKMVMIMIILSMIAIPNKKMIMKKYIKPFKINLKKLIRSINQIAVSIFIQIKKKLLKNQYNKPKIHKENLLNHYNKIEKNQKLVKEF